MWPHLAATTATTLRLLLAAGSAAPAAVLGDGSGAAASCEISVAALGGSRANDSWPVKRQYLGCHSDSGYAFQPTGLYSQLLFGGSFERGLWPATNQRLLGPAALNVSDFTLGEPRVSPAHASTTEELDSTKAAPNTAGSMQIVVSEACSAPHCLAAAANRGLGNSGLKLQGGKLYEGYFFARSGGTPGLGSANSSDVTLTVRLEDYTVKSGTAVLAEQTFQLPADSNWTMFNFTLTPSAATSCRFLDGPEEINGTDVEPCRGAASTLTEKIAEHSCIECGGQLTLGVASATGPTGVSFATVHLQAAQWGRVADLPVQKESANWLKGMGVNLLRMGQH